MWQEAVALAGDVIRAVRQGVRRETKIVSDALMEAALAIGTHIADGYARSTPEEQRDSYLSAKRALLRLETGLAAARHAELIPAGALQQLTSRSTQVSRLLAGYLAYLDRELADGPSRPPPARPPPASVSPDSARAPA